MINYYKMSDLVTMIAQIGAKSILIFILGWIISSIPIYLAAKAFNSDVSFSKALGATLISGIIASIIVIISFYISKMYGVSLLYIVGMVIAFIAILGVYKSVFNVGWGAAFGILVVAVIIIIIFVLILFIFGISIPYLQTFISSLYSFFNSTLHNFSL
jgi:hypothetical protein